MKIIFLTILLGLVALSVKGQSEVQTWKLYYDSTQLYWAKDWNQTTKLLRSAEQSAIVDIGIYDENYLTIVNDLGIAYWKTKDYNTAEKLLSKNLAIKSEIYPQNDPKLFSSICNLAALHTDNGNWIEAKNLYKRIVHANEPDINSTFFFLSVRNLISLYDTYDQPDSALNLIIEIQDEVKYANRAQMVELEIAKAHATVKLHRHEDALQILNPLLKDLPVSSDPEYQTLRIKTLQALAGVYSETGLYTKAEKYLLTALHDLKSGINDNKLLTEVFNHLASIYERLNIYDKALAYYEESLARCQMAYGNNTLECSIIETNIAGIQLKQGHYDLAIERYKHLLVQVEMNVKHGDPIYIASLNNLATAYRSNKQYDKALVCLDTAVNLIKKYGYGQRDLGAIVMNNYGVLSTSLGNYDQASTYFQQAYKIKSSIFGENSMVLMDLIGNLAVVNWALKKPDVALPLFKQSMEMARKQVKYIFPNLNESEQIQFYNKIKEDFERFNTIAIQYANIDRSLVLQMFNNQTLIKSLMFFTGKRRAQLIHDLGDSTLLQQVETLRYKREQLGHLYQLPLQDLNISYISFQHLEKEIDQLEKEISLKTSEALSETSVYENCGWEIVNSSLKKDEALVEVIRFRKYDFQKENLTGKEVFGFTDSIYYASIVTTAEMREPHLIVMKDGNNFETRFLSYYRNALRYQYPDANSYKSYWKPLESSLKGKTKIYLCSDGAYHKLNLNTLFDEATAGYLLDKYDINYLLNPSQLLVRDSVNIPAKNAVLIGDPVFDVDLSFPATSRMFSPKKFNALPGTLQEIISVDKILQAQSWQTQLFLKVAAKESNLKKVNSPGILHIATHGFFSEDVVKLNEQARKGFLFHSGLLLTGANKSIDKETFNAEDDGIVTAFEVLNLNLTHTDLVVLSACETGLGKIENGEGVFGLQRSFQQAGAKNVLISLWKVDDAVTKDLMIKFYQHYTKGKSIRQSLKEAQLDIRLQHSDPTLWGGFVVVGAAE
jgi:CHAT domain-containing protein/Tfp pilus assembly protein PilF